MNNSKTQFKDAIFLFEDKKGWNEDIEKRQLKVEKLDQAFGLMKTFLPKSVLPEQILNAMPQAWVGIDNLIKELSGYPDGDVETILKLWGRLEHYKKAKEFISNDVFHFVKYSEREYIFKEGKFSFNKELIPEIKQNFIHFTTNKKQNKYLYVLKKLSDGLNEAFDSGLIFHDPKPLNFSAIDNTKVKIVQRISRLLTVENERVVPNLDSIRFLKE